MIIKAVILIILGLGILFTYSACRVSALNKDQEQEDLEQAQFLAAYRKKNS